MISLARACAVIALLATGCAAESQPPPTATPGTTIATTVGSTPSSTPRGDAAGCTYRPPALYLDMGVLEASTLEITAADLNGDGLSDLIVTRDQDFQENPITLLVNVGGRFEDQTGSLIEGDIPETVFAAGAGVVDDLNGDGDVDLFIGDSGEGGEWALGHDDVLLLSRGDGTFEDGSERLPRGGFFVSGGATDVDRDGDQDLFVGNIHPPPPSLLLNDGAGGFTVADGALPDFLQPLDDRVYTTSAFADVTGDGFPDLILGANQGAPESLVLRNDGTGRMVRLGPLPTRPGGTDGVSLLVLPEDLDDDGIVDLIVHHTRFDFRGRYTQILMGNGDGTFADQTDERLEGATDPNGAWFMKMYLLDLDGDGDDDLLARTIGEGPLVYDSDGAGAFALIPGGPPVGSYLFEPGDFNGDGVLDFVYSNPSFQGSREQHWVVLGDC